MLNRYALSFLIIAVLPVSWLADARSASGQALDRLGGGWGNDAEDTVTVSAQFTTARLFITAKIKDGWHIYSTTQPPGGPVATKIKLDDSDAYKVIGQWQVAPAPDKKPEPAFGGLTVESHHGVVIWFAPIELAPGVDPASLQIAGQLQVQPCNVDSCLPPRYIPFEAALGEATVPTGAAPAEPGAAPASKQPPATEPPVEPAPPTSAPAPSPDHSETELPWQPFSMARFRHAVGPDFDPDLVQENLRKQLNQSSIWWQVFFGFLGGILLNLMPCVLPVIGLKILAFVEQAGQNRWQALLLNIWYSLGLIFIFLLLASLAVFLNYGWGNLFRLPAFNIVMAGVLFAMGLSFLGLWEIPIPGFVWSSRAAELGEKEGFLGAFSKGMITTILATPCTGPFMGASLAWAVSQPPVNTYAVFFSVGLGMASPYLLIGAFPALIKFVPKPGAWMETFKHIMGFVLFGTVVYLFTFFQLQYVVPTIGLLFVLWGALWWVNRTPPTADTGAKLRAWLESAIFVALMWLLLFPGLGHIIPDVGLIPAVERIPGLHGVMQGRLDQKLAQFHEKLKAEGWEKVRDGYALPTGPSGGQTVLIDCTADWCPTCKTLEATCLNTKPVRELVATNRVLALTADWTHEQPEVTELLEILGNKAVPTVAVFPANDPNNPIVFRGWYSQQDILDALNKAGPSRQ